MKKMQQQQQQQQIFIPTLIKVAHFLPSSVRCLSGKCKILLFLNVLRTSFLLGTVLRTAYNLLNPCHFSVMSLLFCFTAKKIEIQTGEEKMAQDLKLPTC